MLELPLQFGRLRIFEDLMINRFRATCSRAAACGSLLLASLLIDACGGDGGTVATPVTRTLAISVSGLPTGAAADIAVVGPAGIWHITRDTTFRDVAPGSYRLTASNVSTNSLIFAVASPTQTVEVTTGTQSISVVYQSSANFGTLRIAFTGVPAGSGRVNISGPLSSAITVDTLLTLLPPGSYSLGARPYFSSPTVGTGDPQPLRALTVVAGGQYSEVFAYTAGPARFQVSVLGVPSTLTPPVRVLNSAAAVLWTASKTETSTTLTVPVGLNRIVADSVEDATTRYRADTASAFVEGLPSYTRPIVVQYRPRTAVLAPIFANVPLEAALTTRLEREDGSLVATATGGAPRFFKIEAGRYVLKLDSSLTTQFRLAPTVGRLVVDLNAGAVATPVVNYIGTPLPGFNLAITDVAVVQAIHGATSPVALVAGREALVRVTARASTTNGVIAPSVRLELSDLGGVFKTITIPPMASGVPVVAVDSVLGSTYNVVLAAADVRRNLRVRATIDPDGVVPEASRADNVYPATGTLAVSVAEVPVMRLVLVPTQLADSAAPILTSAGADSLLSLTRMLWPLRQIDVSIRAPFTSVARSTDADVGTTLVADMTALRQTDGASLQTYYVSVVRSGAGVATLGTRVAAVIMSPAVMAHEVGHMFGRMHATTCTGLVLGGLDPGYPYLNGSIGSWGWDVRSGALVSPKAGDIMGQCSVQWVSDYMWTGALQYRAARDTVASARSVVEAASSRTFSRLVLTGSLVDGKLKTRVHEALNSVVSSADAHDARVIVRSTNGALVADIGISLNALADHPNTFVFSTVLDQPASTLDGAHVEILRAGVVVGRGRVNRP